MCGSARGRLACTVLALLTAAAAARAAAPVANDDTVTTAYQVAVRIKVLGNDTDNDGDALTLVGFPVKPAHGSVSKIGQMARYAPRPGFTGEDFFTYRVMDTTGLFRNASVRVSVDRPPASVSAATLSWSIPTTRANGTPLAMGEIAGYEIYVIAESSGERQVIRVERGETTRHTIAELAPDTYHFAIVAMDTNGNPSELSPVVSKTIASQ